MSVKLLAERHLEYLSLKGGCTGSSESTLVKIPHCWKSHVAAHKSGYLFVCWCSDMEYILDLGQSDLHLCKGRIKGFLSRGVGWGSSPTYKNSDVY